MMRFAAGGSNAEALRAPRSGENGTRQGPLRLLLATRVPKGSTDGQPPLQISLQSSRTCVAAALLLLLRHFSCRAARAPSGPLRGASHAQANEHGQRPADIVLAAGRSSPPACIVRVRKQATPQRSLAARLKAASSATLSCGPAGRASRSMPGPISPPRSAATRAPRPIATIGPSIIEAIAVGPEGCCGGRHVVANCCRGRRPGDGTLRRDYRWPNVSLSLCSDWLLNVEANRWAYDWGDGPKAYLARIERMLDFCFLLQDQHGLVRRFRLDVHRFRAMPS